MDLIYLILTDQCPSHLSRLGGKRKKKSEEKKYIVNGILKHATWFKMMYQSKKHSIILCMQYIINNTLSLERDLSMKFMHVFFLK